MASRERERNLRQQLGATAAAAVGESRDQLQRFALQQRVLAAQMLDFERTVATVREARALDRKQIESQALDISRLRARVISLERDRDALLRWVRRVEGMTFAQRLRRLFTGELRFTPRVETESVDASPQSAYPGDGL